MAQKQSSTTFCLLCSAVFVLTLMVQQNLVLSGLVNDNFKHWRNNDKLLSLNNHAVKSYSDHKLQMSRRNNSDRLFLDDFFNLFSNAASAAIVDGDDSDDDEEDTFRNCTCNCGVVNQETRIVGGQITGIHRYPWVARLVYDGQFHCGGSLLNADYVLTAAHCVRRLRRSKFKVVLGDHDQFSTTESPAVMRAVSAIIRHKNFDGTNYNHDIALLKLRRPVTFSKQVRPVCLPSSGTDPPAKSGTVVGWGRTSEGGVIPSHVMEVQVPILSLSDCRKMQYRPSRISSYMLCAGTANKDSCQGDSGGPLLIQNGAKYEVHGIVSWGVGCGRPGYPGVYTRVARYLEWVKRNMRDSCQCVK
ncbi:trypsin-1-like [Neocloeon triangulifer]|uniref:trypsin-1-like n=1 Tax=Neocloeon triangulifer TaxID=2078957 RepID=UPI00286F7D69|nr:trypsin-1-like [Neocloeon triangulifer]